jgi:hypothetical protein
MEENQDSTQTKEIDKIPHLDNVLWTLASIVVDNGISFDITLNVKGIIIFGTLITQQQYFEEVNQKLTGSENGEMFGNLLSQIGEYQEKESKFIHLKNAKYQVGDNHIPSNEGVCWRGRLTEIDGFNLGSFSTST